MSEEKSSNGSASSPQESSDTEVGADQSRPDESQSTRKERDDTGDSEPEDTEEGEGQEDFNPFLELFRLRDTEPEDKEITGIVNRYVDNLVRKSKVADRYNVLVLIDQGMMMRSDADRIYRALDKTDPTRPILLILSSDGGDISSAYFIGKLCRDKAKDELSVVVPRRAKSAATLICCAADRIHLGSLSELGPIDPQFEGVPALALKYSIEHLAELARRYPAASDMFAKYLSQALNIQELGYYERVAESAAQYAERLLKARKTQNSRDIAEIAHRLVYTYKDHGFVIDATESWEIFGKEIVKTNTDEYDLGNSIFSALAYLEQLLRGLFRKGMYFTGSPDNGCEVFDLQIEA